MSRIVHMIPQNAAWSQQQTSTGTGDVKTFTPPTVAGQTGQKAHACLITVETTTARVTFNNDAPDATHGHIFQTAQPAVYIPAASVIKMASTAGTSSIVTVTWLH